MKYLIIISLLLIGCSRPKESTIFCFIERLDNTTSKAFIEFEIDGIYEKKVVLLPYRSIYYVERYITIRWLPQRVEYNGYLDLNGKKYNAKWDEWNLYKEIQINIKKPNGMNGTSWIW